MRFSDLLSAALANLRQRAFRTFLTVLGVLIGTVSVVVMISIGAGLASSFDAQTNTLSLRTVDIHGAPSKTGGTEARLTGNTIQELAQTPGVEAVIPVYRMDGSLKLGSHEVYPEVFGIPAEGFEAFEFDYRWGGPPTSTHQLQAVYGGHMQDNFFDWTTGEELDVDLENQMATLNIGQMESFDSFGDAGFTEPGFNTDDGADPDGETVTAKLRLIPGGQIEEPDMVYGPYSSAVLVELDALVGAVAAANPGKKLPEQTVMNASPKRPDFVYSSITLLTTDADATEEIMTQLREEGYDASAEIEWIKSAQEQTNIIQAVLGSIGAVSLLVAAIGIANTMLMSVYERTKEIGVMKVLGASLRDIRSLFLLESGTIGFIGGVFGVILSFAVSFALNSLMPQDDTMMMDPAQTAVSVISPWLALAAVIGATLIGMLSGFAPAQRATRLSPLNAIRTQ